MNAAMDIINHGHYMGWELPKGCTVVLSANPEDKDYQVSYLDDAQKTRFFNFNVEFDLEYYLDEKNTIEMEFILDLKTNLFKDKLSKEDVEKINANPNFIEGEFKSNKLKINFKE